MRNEPGFLDLRQWIDLLEREGELHRITAPVTWDREIGTISRKVLERKGPALLFENIRGYEYSRGRRVFTGGIGTRERLALALWPRRKLWPRRVFVGAIRPAYI